MRRRYLGGLALAASFIIQGVPGVPVRAAALSAPQGRFTMPASNVAWSGPLLDSRRVVYGVAVPRVHRPVCVSCGQQPFTNFRVQMYVRSYLRISNRITIGPQRPLFTGPRGAQIRVYSLAAGWLVYTTDQPGDRWALFARNLDTAQVITLDSPQMEELPSRFLHAASDGRTVVWGNWTRLHARITSVIRSYTFASGRRQRLLVGGSASSYWYGYPQVSGNRVIVLKESSVGSPASQILLEDPTTHRLRAITPAGQMNDEPFISGNLLVWVHGPLGIGSRHGLVVMNLATGRRVALKHSSAQLPRIAGDRYIVFATDRGRPTVQAYDSQSGTRRTIATSAGQGATLGSFVEVGATNVLFSVANPCGTPAACPGHFVITSLA